MMMRPTCMSCQTDLIGRDGIWSHLIDTLLIAWSYDVYLMETFLIGSSDISVFKRRFTISYSHSRLTRNDYANAFSFGEEYAVLICR